MNALLKPMQRYRAMILQLRDVPVSADGLTLALALTEARNIARNEGIDMVVGLGQSDATGEPEWNYCPLQHVGPAFVVDVRYMVASHGAHTVFLVDFDAEGGLWVGLRPLNDGQVAAILEGREPETVLQ